MVDKEKIKELIICFLAELFGTAFLVFLGCVSCIGGVAFHCGFNWGLSVMVVVQIFGCVSGGHVNPAVTIAAAILQVVDIPAAVVYIIAQILGGLIGYGLIFGLVPKVYVQPVTYLTNARGLCVLGPGENTGMVQTLIIEIVITLILVMACCSVWDARNAANKDSVPIRIGFTVACLILAMGGFTGGSLNPARALPPALYHLQFDDVWIYLVAPLISAIIGPLLYKFVFGEGGVAAAE